MYPKVYLKPGKDKPLMAHHHWVFSGAILKKDADVASGGVVDVYSSDHKYLATGYFNERTSIAIRLLAFEPTPIDGNFLWDRIYQAWNLRTRLFPSEDTNCYRVFFSEGDFLPGLVVDRYGEGVVFQIQTLGLETLREQVIEILEIMIKPSFIYEKSEGTARSEEGLEPVSRLHRGTLPDGGVPVTEHGARFLVDIPKGQKTGFFLDQRENRRLVRDLSQGRSVLNCFGYTGGFSVNAALGGAPRTVTVEASQPALALARENFRLNGLDAADHALVAADVFQHLRECREKYDLVILDPPAFAKRQASMTAAFRGYKDINLQAMGCLRPGGLLLTCSCSYYVDPPTFQKILFMAARDAGRQVQILQKMPQPPDHPINLLHPESEYLKAFLCRIL
jgi:23S rRNA (cytosine1962-C5)-methyltransferase